MLHRLHVFWSLNGAERAALAEALALPMCISVGFQMLGVPRTQALLRRWALGRKTRTLEAHHQLAIRDAQRAQRVVKRTTGVAGNCLSSSLTLWAMLLRRGISTDLRVGFRKREGEIQGHAWLEYNEAPITDDRSETQTFVPYEKPVSFDMLGRIKRNQPAGRSR